MKIPFSFLLVGLSLVLEPVTAAPQRKSKFLNRFTGGAAGNANGNAATAATGATGRKKAKKAAKGKNRGNNAAAATGGANANGNTNGQARLSTATDGSTIVDMTMNINNLPIRFKVSAPASQFLTSTGIPGASASANATTNMGLNVLLHGDGGQSFFDFPNQAVQSNLMGVVALAPNTQRFWGGGSGLNRVDGAEHSAAVNSLIQDILPQMVNFNPSNVFFTGVSGGSLMLSGFFVPQFMTLYKTGVELNCGALEPQVNFVDAAGTLAATRVHFQSTQQELQELQGSIPQAVTAYEGLARQAGLSDTQINEVMTVDNSPNGGHCEFDGRDFVTGVQLMASNYAAVMQGGNGFVPGIGMVTNGVVGNENLQFAAGGR